MHRERVVIVPYADGPYLVRGPVLLRDQDGRNIEVRRRTIALCRCGKSRMRPFCDGTHQSIRFRAPSAAEARAPGSPSARARGAARHAAGAPAVGGTASGSGSERLRGDVPPVLNGRRDASVPSLPVRAGGTGDGVEAAGALRGPAIVRRHDGILVRLVRGSRRLGAAVVSGAAEPLAAAAAVLDRSAIRLREDRP